MITEDQLEQLCIDWFRELGWDYKCGYDIAPNTDNPMRKNYQEVILESYLRRSLEKINPGLPDSVIDEVVTKLIRLDSSILEVNNRQFHRFVTENISVDIRTDERTKGDFVKIIDFENPENNHFLIVNQFTIQGSNGNRRPDIVAFINGLPIAVLELKNPGDENADICKAFEQIGTYKEELPDLFNYNLACIISDGYNARIGSITAGKERYGHWRIVKTEGDRPLFEFELETMV